MIKSRLAVVTVLSVIAYLGLAIVGAGGPSRFFSYPPLIAVSVVTIALGVVGLFSEGHIGSGVKEDRSNRWVIAALGVLGVLDAYLPAYTDRIDFLTFGGEGVRWLGVLLYTAGGILRLAPVFVLGRRFSGLVAIQPEHRLVSGGLYGIIRHPSYLGLFVLMLGWGLAFRSGAGVVIAVLSLGVLLARIRAEERLLSETFGAEYDAYRARTWRLIPYVY
jgi:protein-S-isoprenylcysteine O-methyltransferase Ste14